MCTIRLIELTVAWQNSKPVSCVSPKCNKFCTAIQLGLRFFFLQDTEIEKPDYTDTTGLQTCRANNDPLQISVEASRE